MALNFQIDEATAGRRRFPLYLVDGTDGITAETGEAAGQPQLSKNGGAFGNTSATLSAIGNGSYYVELTAAELDTLGLITIRFKSGNTAEFSLTGQIVAYDPYAAYALASIATETRLAELDSGNIPTDLSGIQSDTDDIQSRLPTTLNGGRMDADVGALAGIVQSLTDLKDFADAGYDPGTNKVQGVVLVDTTSVNSDMVGTNSAALASVVGALADSASDGDPTVADTLMQYIKQLINVLVGSAGVVAYPTAVAPGNGVNLAEILREIFDDVAGVGGITPSIAGDSMALTAAAVDDIWNEAKAGHVGGGSFGEEIQLHALTSEITALNDIAITDILSDSTAFAGANIDAAITSRLAPTVAARTLDVAVTGEAGVDFSNINGTLDAGEIGAAALTAAKFAAGAIDASALATDAIDKIRDGLLPTQNVAFNNISFLFVAASDHVTPVTGATGMAVTRSIDGGAFGAGTGTLAEVANGIYQYDASQADMNGGVITFRFTASGGTPGAADDTFVTIVTGGGV